MIVVNETLSADDLIDGDPEPGKCWCGRFDLTDEHDWQPGCDDDFPFDGDVSLNVMLGIKGMTYRRLDYWTRIGLLTPGNDGQGTGTKRTWTGRDWEIARLTLALTNAGIDVHVANAAAVAGVDHGEHIITIGSVTLEWTVEP